MAILTGDDENNFLTGSGAADTMEGRGGADQLKSGGGNDAVRGGDGGDQLDGGDGDDVIFGHGAQGTDPNAGAVFATRVGAGFDLPLFATSAPGDPNRLFVVEQHTGAVRILNLTTGKIAPEAFLNIPDNEMAQGSEQGLLGFTFHPDFANNHQAFIYLSNADGDTEIRRYNTLPGNPDVIDPASETLVITFDQPPNDSIHYGGWLGFGPDGFLYISSGDGGGVGDPNNNAQNLDSFLGKILRIDVDGDDFPKDVNRNYAIPADNPFVGAAGAGEIWAYGLRNPWRPSFDSVTGDFFIADVGQSRFEEINFQTSTSAGGENYGWKVLEGVEVYDDSVPSNPAPYDPSLVDPVHVYELSTENGRSVTGGYVYHGPAQGLKGFYVFGDYVSGRIATFRIDDGEAIDFTNLTSRLLTNAGDIGHVASFGVDGHDNLYVISREGEIHRLDPTLAAADGADSIFGGNGNDRAYGGAGRDYLNGGASEDFLRGGLDDDVVFGASGNDRLYGDAGSDRLDGGTGADKLFGGIGNDTYRIDSASDRVVDVAGEGTDTLNTGVNYSLREQDLDVTGNLVNVQVEVLRAVYTGTTGIKLFGNSFSERIYGGLAGDTLNGRAGTDTMNGGLGNDTYVVDTAGDIVVESSTVATQIDTVNSSVTRTLGANQEYLTLTGSAAINGIGNNLANRIVGNSAVNVLNGGVGADTMNGGGGADTFRYTTGNASLDTARDLIQGFAPEDQINLSLLDANTGTAANDPFRVVTSLTIAQSTAGSLYLGPLSGSERLTYLNMDADTAFEMLIRIQGTISTADFTL